MESRKTTASEERLSWRSRLFPEYGGNTKLLAYVLSVIAVGIGVLCASGWWAGAATLLTFSFFAWFVFNLGSEFLWLETGTGDATDSAALTMNFAVILLLSPSEAVIIIGCSVFLATRFIQKRDTFKAFFGLGQMVLTTAIASGIFRWIHPEAISIESFLSIRGVVAMLVCATAYFLVNTFLVARAISLQLGAGFISTWRENWAYRNCIVSTIALFSLAPILILAFRSIGYPGVFLFFLPLLIIKNQNREYINLQKMMQERVDREKMAERGKLAAAVAHEMNNYLAIINGRIQLLSARAARLGEDKMRNDTDVIREQIQHMSSMAKGLMDFSHKGVRTEETDINRFLVRQIDLLRPYPVLKDVEILPELSPETGIAEIDQGQIQQVIVNLVKNAAEAIKGQESPPPNPTVAVRSRTEKGDRVRIEIEDNGPGMPSSVQEKIWDAFYSTKKDGHGFGLATCKTILKNHKGDIWVESDPGQGTTFVLDFPRQNPDGRTSAIPQASAPPKKSAAPVPPSEGAGDADSNERGAA